MILLSLCGDRHLREKNPIRKKNEGFFFFCFAAMERKDRQREKKGGTKRETDATDFYFELGGEIPNGHISGWIPRGLSLLVVVLRLFSFLLFFFFVPRDILILFYEWRRSVIYFQLWPFGKLRRRVWKYLILTKKIDIFSD